MGCLNPASLPAQDPREALSRRRIELDRCAVLARRLLRQHRQHHVVELLDAASALHLPTGFGGLRELNELRPAPRCEHRCGLRRQPRIVRLEPVLEELRERDLGRRVFAHLKVLSLEMLPGNIIAEADEHLVLVAKERGGG